MNEMMPPGSYIKSVEIVGLFGECDYWLSAPNASDPRVLVLYGQNGAGKTTILKILRSLLSAEENAGHRTWLAKVPFERVSVELMGGLVVEAQRKDASAGAYKWTVRKPGAEALHLQLRPRDGRIRADHWDQNQRDRDEEIRAELRSAVPTVSYLDDKRTFMNRSKDGRPRLVTRKLPDGTFVRVPVAEDGAFDDDDPVQLALRDLVQSVRRDAFLLSNRGNQGAQSIYSSLLDRIISNPALNSPSALSVEELEQKLTFEQARSESLSAYGLVTPVDHSEMLSALQKVSGDNSVLVVNVLSPYIETLTARFDALQALHGSIDRWVENLRGFLSPKSVLFRIGDEVRILSKLGHDLAPSVLSSGERHLLMLMTEAFLMRNQGGLMLVDEPELSLNVAWQRELISAMVGSFGGGACQLVVASHSLEIAAKFESNLVVFG